MENQEVLDIQAQIERLNSLPHSTGDFYLEEPWWGYIVMRGDQQALYRDRFSWVISPVFRHARDLGIWLDGYLHALEDAHHFTPEGAILRVEQQPVVAR
jgi:hypothetical protein